MCDGIDDCPPSESSGGGEDEDDCGGEINWIEIMPAKSMLGRLYL